ncbi:MAG: DUF4271 domain-containing protein [Bacteroidota bacterium]
MKRLFVIFVIINLSAILYGQQQANPFEILGRATTSEKVVAIPSESKVATNPFEMENLTEAVVSSPAEAEVKEEAAAEKVTVSIPETTTIATKDTVKVLVDSENPFEILVRSGASASTIEETDIAEVSNTNSVETTIAEPPQHETQQDNDQAKDHILTNIKPAGKADGQQGQFFGLMLLTLVPVTILFTLFRAFFSKAYENILSANVLNRSYREYAGASIIPLNIWYIIFLLNLGIFVSLIMNYYGAAFTKQPLINGLICTGIVSVLVLGKRLLLALLGEIFPFKKEMQLYRYLLLLFGIVTGVFLAPINIAIIYAGAELLSVLIYGALALLAAIYLIRSYRALIVGNRFLLLDRFHFLLYICAVEIAPIFIIIKLVLLYLA